MQVRVRELERADLPTINSWRNDSEIVEHLGANSLFIAPEIDERWYDAYLASRDRTVRLAIDAPGHTPLVGCVYLTDIHRINRTAELSILIGDKAYWSKGCGTAATQMMLAHAFDDLNLNRVYLTVLTENVRAIGLYEKAGFRKEGTQRCAVFKGGRFRDLDIMAILQHEYRSLAAMPSKAPSGQP